MDKLSPSDIEGYEAESYPYTPQYLYSLPKDQIYALAVVLSSSSGPLLKRLAERAPRFAEGQSYASDTSDFYKCRVEQLLNSLNPASCGGDGSFSVCMKV